MTRSRKVRVGRWAGRVAAAAALMSVVLLAAAGPVWAFGADGSGQLGQTPPVLSWIELTDSRGISIWNYELSLDRGGVTSPDKFFWSAVTDSAWGAYRSWCALALWFLDWVLSFDWLRIIAAPLLTAGDAMQSVVAQIGATKALLTITAVAAVVWMMCGRWATGIWELAIALVIASLASGVFAQPVRMLAGDRGLIAQSQQWGLSLSTTLANHGEPAGQNAEQLRKAQMGQLVDTFVRAPTQLVNFGRVLDGGKCEDVYNEALKGGPYGTKSTIRDKVNGCDRALGEYAAQPTASMGLGSLLFMPASVVVLLLTIVLAGSVIAAGCNAMFQGLKAIVTLVTGLLPGGGRGSLMLTAAETVIAMVIILFTGVFLGIFLQVVQALFKSGSGESFPRTFAIVDIVLVVGIVIYRRQRQRLKDAAHRTAALLSKRPGRGPTRLPAQSSGGLRSTAGSVTRSAVSLAHLKAMRGATGAPAAGPAMVDARRQAVIFAGAGPAGSNGPVDIGPVSVQPNTRDGPGPRPRLPGPRPGPGNDRSAQAAVLGTLARAGSRVALAAGTGGSASVATAAVAGVKAGVAANDARRLTRAAVQARLASAPAAGPARPAPGSPRGPIPLPAGRGSTPTQPQASAPATGVARSTPAADQVVPGTLVAGKPTSRPRPRPPGPASPGAPPAPPPRPGAGPAGDGGRS